MMKRFALTKPGKGSQKLDATSKSATASSSSVPYPRLLSAGVIRESDALPDPQLIGRRPLTPTTERQLRIACAEIVRNFKPSDHGLDDVDPKLDFYGPAARREARKGPDVEVRRPTGAPAHHADRANTGRRRAAHLHTGEYGHDARKTVGSLPVELPVELPAEPPKAAQSHTRSDTGTPHTGSTDVHGHYSLSTAPTTAAGTTGSSSQRISRQDNNWAAHQYPLPYQPAERPSHNAPVQQPQPPKTPQARPPTRSKSFTELRDYIFPRSATLSRKQSRESVKTQQLGATAEPKRSGSSHAWRSWGGLQRMSSSRSSRPGTSGTASGAAQTQDEAQTQSQSQRPEINLNRDLPPLPSLDTWDQQQGKEREKEKERGKCDAHIATVMRLQDHSSPSPSQQQQQQQQQQHPPRTSSMRGSYQHQHKRSGSDSLAMHSALEHPTISKAAAARSGSLRTRHQTMLPMRPRSPPQAAHQPQQTHDSSNTSNGTAKQHIEESAPGTGLKSLRGSTKVSTTSDSTQPSSSHSHSTSTSHHSHSTSRPNHNHHSNPNVSSTPHPMAQSCVAEPPNFSRKISTDLPRLSSSPSIKQKQDQRQERPFDERAGSNKTHDNETVFHTFFGGSNSDRDRSRSKSEAENHARLVPGTEESGVVRARSAAEGEKQDKGNTKSRLRKALSSWVLRKDRESGKEREKESGKGKKKEQAKQGVFIAGGELAAPEGVRS